MIVTTAFQDLYLFLQTIKCVTTVSKVADEKKETDEL